MGDLGEMFMLKNLNLPTGEIFTDICQQCISLLRYMLTIPISLVVILKDPFAPNFHLGVKFMEALIFTSWFKDLVKLPLVFKKLL